MPQDWTGLFLRGRTEPEIVCRNPADAIKIRREMFGARVDLKPYQIPQAQPQAKPAPIPKPKPIEVEFREPLKPRTVRKSDEG